MRIVICGAGRVGFYLGRYLSEHQHHVTLVDKNPKLIQKINERLEANAVQGCATDPNVLEQAGTMDADLFIAVTQSDEVNMVACEMADALFNVPKKIARIRNQAYLDPRWSGIFKQNNLAIDVAISPEVEVAKAISRSLRVPGAIDVIPLEEGRLKIVGVRMTATTPVVNTPLSHLTNLFPKLHMNVVGLVRGEKSWIPTARDILLENDEVYFVVAQEMLTEAMKAFGLALPTRGQMIILGGGNIGLRLAQEMAQMDTAIRLCIIEKNAERAAYIAQILETSPF